MTGRTFTSPEMADKRTEQLGPLPESPPFEFTVETPNPEFVEHVESRGTARSDYWEQLAVVEQAKDRMAEICRAGADAYGSRRAYAEAVGVNESTVRHHEGGRSKGRAARRRTS